MALSALLGALIGAILGLTGAGGGILAVPALSVGMHWSMQQAAPVALIAVAMGASVGAFEGLRRGLVRYKAAALIAVSGLPLVYLGQAIAQQMSQPLLQLCFSAVMLVVAYRLYLQSGQPAGADAPAIPQVGRINPDSGKFVWSIPTAAMLASVGGCTGLLTGLLGVGGGFVIVPLLRKFTQVSMQGIVATSLMVIALVGTGGVASAVLHNTYIAWLPAAVFSATTIVGMVIGRSLIQKISAKHVQMGFAAVLTLVAVGLMAGATRALLQG